MPAQDLNEIKEDKDVRSGEPKQAEVQPSQRLRVSEPEPPNKIVSDDVYSPGGAFTSGSSSRLAVRTWRGQQSSAIKVY